MGLENNCCAICDNFRVESGGTMQQPKNDFYCNEGKFSAPELGDDIYDLIHCTAFIKDPDCSH